MTKSEFMTWFAEQVEPRWSKWQVNACILNDWFVALRRYDTAVLTYAVQQHAIRDDPARPHLNRVLALARACRIHRDPSVGQKEMPSDVVTGAQFWQTVRTTYSKQQRIQAMRALMKFCPAARDKDPEAHDWIMQEQAHSPKSDAPASAANAPGR